VRQVLKHEHGLMPVGIEGTETGKWVLVDYDDVVLHVFLEGTREFYDLENLWAEAPRLPVPEVDVAAAPRFPLP
jgi:ribosome-associated protein